MSTDPHTGAGVSRYVHANGIRHHYLEWAMMRRAPRY